MIIFVIPDDGDDDNICNECGISLNDPDHQEKHERIISIRETINAIEERLKKARWN